MADKVFLPIILKSENISSHNTIVSGLTHPVHISSSPWCPVSLFLGWGLLAWPWAVGGPSLHSPLGSAHMSWPCHFLLVTATLRDLNKLEGTALPLHWASLVAQLVKNPPAIWETWVRSLGWKDPLETGKATHSSIQSMGLQRVGHD